jgi:hypothetical protein
VKVNDIATAAQSLADYCSREGERADLKIVARQAILLTERVEQINTERTREMVTK